MSGLHCGFLIALLGLLTLRRQRLTALVGYPALLVYMLMAGATPSVVRSCVMAAGRNAHSAVTIRPRAKSAGTIHSTRRLDRGETRDRVPK